jgi:hypothetical protein
MDMKTNLRFKGSFAALAAATLSTAILAGCGGGSGGGGGAAPASHAQPNRVAVSVAAGMAALDADSVDTLTGNVVLSDLGVTAFDQVYTLTTPADTDFSFSIVANAPGNAGETDIALAHGLDDGSEPAGGAETIAAKGIQIDGSGVSYNGEWIDVIGDGFARVNFKGSIDSDQLLIIQVKQPDGSKTTIAVDIVLGEPSIINTNPAAASGDAAIKSEKTLFSSNSYQFGLPAIAVSGDRYTVATYDGSETDPYAWERNRRWIQYDAGTDSISGGVAAAGNADWGNWRDQELAAKGNVLAIVYTHTVTDNYNYYGSDVRADISLDRGANFNIHQVLEPPSESWGQRLVQVTMSSDYKIGFLYWRTTGEWPNQTSNLVLIEATPGALDANNTPTGYTFGAAQIIAAPGGDVIPLVMDLKYSDAGDLVIGYGYNKSMLNPNDPEGMTRMMTADFKCAVRLANEGLVTTTVDHEENIVPNDPNIDIRGTGHSMEIFYAYEKTDGVHLAYSSNGGQSFVNAATTGTSGAFMPSVHVRTQDGKTRVDVLYLDPAANGLELHTLHYEDFSPLAIGEVLALTHASVTEIPFDPENLPKDRNWTTTDPNGNVTTDPQAGPELMMPEFWYGPQITVKDVAWFGYDAVTTGDDIAVVIHERTSDNYCYWGVGPMNAMPPMMGAGGDAGSVANAPTGGAAAPPPPAVLLPGLTGTVRAASTADSNQLKLVILD